MFENRVNNKMKVSREIMEHDKRKEIKRRKEDVLVEKDKKKKKISKIEEDNIAKSVDKKHTKSKRKKNKKYGKGIVIGWLVIGLLVGVCGGYYIANKFEALGGQFTEVDEEKLIEGETKPSTEVESDDFVIETPYCDLHFSGAWMDQIDIGQEEGDVHAVSFYGTVEGKERKLLFDILFGDEVGTEIGTLNVDGQSVRVAVQFVDIVVDETWTEEEINTIHAMQEEINYIIDELKAMENFTSVE